MIRLIISYAQDFALLHRGGAGCVFQRASGREPLQQPLDEDPCVDDPTLRRAVRAAGGASGYG